VGSDSSAPYTLLSLKEFRSSFPEIHDINPFIIHGYRPHLSPSQCFSSAINVHNESVNIWSHAFAAVFFAIATSLVVGAYASVIPITDTLIITTYLTTAVACMTTSAAYHTLCASSPETRKTLAKCDWLSIIALMLVSDFPFIYYPFQNDPQIVCAYTSLIAIAASVVAFTISHNKMHTKNRTRIAAFLALIAIASIHIVHAHISCPECAIPSIAIQPFAMYAVGLCFFCSKFPERIRPQSFHTWFNSHQIWHICVVVGATLHFISIMALRDIAR